MAEAFGLNSGLLALVNVAFQSSITLYNTVRSFRDPPKRVRDLEEELHALQGVLLSLTDTVGATSKVDLSALELPLRQCGNACKEFEDELTKCVSRSGADRMSFRDWARLRYMGNDIDSFRLLLVGYQSTINVALADVSLLRSAITAQDLSRHRNMIKTTTDDLQAHLQSIDEKLAFIITQNTTEPGLDAKGLRFIHEEQQSTRKGLEICAQFSKHISQLELDQTSRILGRPGPDDAEAFPEWVTNAGLRDCRERPSNKAADLERHMQGQRDRLLTMSKTTAAYRKHYIPLESNPSLFTELTHTLGLSSALEFHDVLSLDDVELLALVPRPTLALILVFPTSPDYEDEIAERDKDTADYTKGGEDDDVIWYRQTINNACGLYGILHAVSNGATRDFIVPGSHLAHLLASCTPLQPLDRAAILENDEQLESAYKAIALQGDSEVPANPEDEVDFHYVCFVKSHKNGHLYELDGDRKGPIDWGHLDPDHDVLSEKALGVIREFIQRVSRTVGFSLLALAPVE